MLNMENNSNWILANAIKLPPSGKKNTRNAAHLHLKNFILLQRNFGPRQSNKLDVFSFLPLLQRSLVAEVARVV